VCRGESLLTVDDVVDLAVGVNCEVHRTEEHVRDVLLVGDEIGIHELPDIVPELPMLVFRPRVRALVFWDVELLIFENLFECPLLHLEVVLRDRLHHTIMTHIVYREITLLFVIDEYGVEVIPVAGHILGKSGYADILIGATSHTIWSFP